MTQKQSRLADCHPSCLDAHDFILFNGFVRFFKIKHTTPKKKNIVNNKASNPPAPALRCLPPLVKGMPIFLETRAFDALNPKNLFQLNPPLFIAHL